MKKNIMYGKIRIVIDSAKRTISYINNRTKNKTRLFVDKEGVIHEQEFSEKIAPLALYRGLKEFDVL